jgi:hypothetical protein
MTIFNNPVIIGSSNKFAFFAINIFALLNPAKKYKKVKK